MDNFSAFDKSEVKLWLDFFVPGMAEAITPIKYEALTPDMFTFLFRTTGQENREFFFVLLSFDHITDLRQAVSYIEKWHGAKVQYFLEPQQPSDRDDKDDQEFAKFVSNNRGPYRALLAVVDRPRGDGYWATYITVMPGEDLGEKLMHLTEEDQKNIIHTYYTVTSSMPKLGNSNFLDPFINKTDDQIPDDQPLIKNTSNYAFTFFKSPMGGWEFFYDKVLDNHENKSEP